MLLLLTEPNTCIQLTAASFIGGIITLVDKITHLVARDTATCLTWEECVSTTTGVWWRRGRGTVNKRLWKL